MAAPLIVSFWMRAAVTFVDTIYASFLGDAAVAAIGLTVPVEFLMIAIWIGLSTGLTSALSRAMGAVEHAKVEQYLQAAWKMVWIAAPVFTVIGGAVWFLAPRSGLSDEVARSFQVYGTVLIAGSAITTFWSVIPDSVIKAHQDTRSTMWAGILSNLLNVGLNTLFLFVFHWGLFGIAFSTVISRVGGLVYAMARARHHERIRRAAAVGRPGTPDPAPYRAMLSLAIPASLTFVLMATENGLINGLLAASRNATEAIAAFSIYYRIVLFGLQPVIATSVALLPYASRRFGAGDYEGVRLGLRQAGIAVSIYSIAILGPVTFFLAPWLAARLAESATTTEYATFVIRIVPLACLATAPFLMCRPVFEAMQRGRPGLVLAAIRYLVLTAPLAWLGLWMASRSGHPPLYGLILGTLVAGALSSFVFLIWLRKSLRGLPASG